MITKIRRIALLLATSSGIIAATTAHRARRRQPRQPLRATARRIPPLTHTQGSERNPDMITKIRRIALLLATSSGIIAATTPPPTQASTSPTTASPGSPR